MTELETPRFEIEITGSSVSPSHTPFLVGVDVRFRDWAKSLPELCPTGFGAMGFHGTLNEVRVGDPENHQRVPRVDRVYANVTSWYRDPEGFVRPTPRSRTRGARAARTRVCPMDGSVSGRTR